MCSTFVECETLTHFIKAGSCEVERETVEKISLFSNPDQPARENWNRRNLLSWRERSRKIGPLQSLICSLMEC